MVTEKRCYKCKQFKALEQFHKDNSRRDGLTASCKSCQAARVKTDTQKAKFKEYQKQYQKRHSNSSKNRTQYSRDKILRPEILKQRNAVSSANYNAKKYGVLGKVSTAEIRKLFSLYKTCLSCGAAANLSIDHVIPLVKGGPNEFDNLQVLCKLCNQKKGDKAIDYRP